MNESGSFRTTRLVGTSHTPRSEPARKSRKDQDVNTTTVDVTQLEDRAALAVDGHARPRAGSPKVWHRLLASALTGLLLLIPGPVEAQDYDFSTIDVPDATRTVAAGNSTNAIVGEYDDADGVTRGFILQKGTFTTVDVPDSDSTGLNGINASGAYTGTYFDVSEDRLFAFVSVNGAITALDPLGSIQSQAGFINARGQVVGGYRNASGRRLAFFWSKGVFTTIDPAPTATLGPVAFGINDRGQVVGTYVDPAGNRHGFLWSAGSYTTLDVPDAVFTVAQGINNAGQIVGLYLGTDDTLHGFVLSDGVYTTVDVPGSTSTSVYSINAKGEIVGEFDDADGTHGFLGTPAR